MRMTVPLLKGITSYTTVNFDREEKVLENSEAFFSRKDIKLMPVWKQKNEAKIQEIKYCRMYWVHMKTSKTSILNLRNKQKFKAGVKYRTVVCTVLEILQLICLPWKYICVFRFAIVLHLGICKVIQAEAAAAFLLSLVLQILIFVRKPKNGKA